MKVLVDMNLSPHWATALLSQGIESTHWSKVGNASAPDDEVLAWCAAHGHVLFTHDLDEPQSHPDASVAARKLTMEIDLNVKL